EEYTPSTYNDPELTERLAAVFTQTLGEDRVRWVEPVMAGEDFALYGIKGEIPITIMWLGAVEPAKVEAYAERGEQLPGLHSAEFTVFPEPALRTGVTAMTAAVLDLMQP
ncbi:MAG: M20/M25/M40 family metallo-hydrolase, partial [Thermoanaerobaculia bacterium]